MGNYSTSPLALSSQQREVTIHFVLHPLEAVHRLDPEYRQSFYVKENTRPSFVRNVDEFERTISIDEEGKKGYFTFILYFTDDVSESLEGELQVEFCLKVLQAPEMVGAPGMIRNTVTIPIHFANLPENLEVTFDLDCRFN